LLRHCYNFGGIYGEYLGEITPKPSRGVHNDSAVLHGTTDVLASNADMSVVAACSDGTTALQAICQLAPSVAVLDFLMPGLNALDVLEGISALSIIEQPWLRWRSHAAKNPQPSAFALREKLHLSRQGTGKLPIFGKAAEAL
jgi:CheY-like chemotaxis protein